MSPAAAFTSAFTSASRTLAARLVGISLKPAHMAALRAMRPALGFLEVHSDSLLTEDGAALQGLLDLRALYPFTLHDAGGTLAPEADGDEAHLARLAQLARLVERIEPVRVTATTGTLVPLPFNGASINTLVANIQRVQERLQRNILIENLSIGPRSGHDTLPEAEFLWEVCQRSGCQLLLDMNRLVVNGLNRARRASWDAGAPAFDEAGALRTARAGALDVVWALPSHIVGQLRLAGFRWPEAPDQLFIDDHSQRVSPTVWDVYEQTLAHVVECPTVVAWDADLPPLAVLLDEARLAAEAMARAQGASDEDDDDDEDL